MIASLPTRNEVKQILQILYEEDEITDEMIDDAIAGGMYFINLNECPFREEE